MTANNQRLFRVAWSILKNSVGCRGSGTVGLSACFREHRLFEGRSALSTWLTRIVLNEALGRQRAATPPRHLEQRGRVDAGRLPRTLMRGSEAERADVAFAREQIRMLIEHAVAALPEAFRTVFVLREIEGLSSEQTAEILDVPVATVKTRLFRGRSGFRSCSRRNWGPFSPELPVRRQRLRGPDRQRSSSPRSRFSGEIEPGAQRCGG